MVACQQKYCKYCVKPKFDNNGKFKFGWCKFSRNVLFSNDYGECHKNNEVQPLYCYKYIPRKRKIKY